MDFEIEIDAIHKPSLKEREQANGILIIEDDNADMLLIEKSVQELIPDIEIFKAKSLNEAYRNYKEEDFNLILLDLNLPDGIGPRSVLELRKFKPKIPVMAITGFLTDITKSVCRELGAVTSISKSNLNTDEFSEKLYNYVGVKAA